MLTWLHYKIPIHFYAVNPPFCHMFVKNSLRWLLLCGMVHHHAISNRRNRSKFWSIILRYAVAMKQIVPKKLSVHHYHYPHQPTLLIQCRFVSMNLCCWYPILTIDQATLFQSCWACVHCSPNVLFLADRIKIWHGLLETTFHKHWKYSNQAI